MPIDTALEFGTPEHAEAVTRGRHPGVRDALQWLTFAHLPATLQDFSAPFYENAVTIIGRITTDAPELTTALNTLIAAKDAGVRAGIKHTTGRAGSVPRPVDLAGADRVRAYADTPAGQQLAHEDGMTTQVGDGS